MDSSPGLFHSLVEWAPLHECDNVIPATTTRYLIKHKVTSHLWNFSIACGTKEISTYFSTSVRRLRYVIFTYLRYHSFFGFPFCNTCFYHLYRLVPGLWKMRLNVLLPSKQSSGSQKNAAAPYRLDRRLREKHHAGMGDRALWIVIALRQLEIATLVEDNSAVWLVERYYN